MTILTAAAVLTLAASCQNVVAPETIVKMAVVESHFDTDAVNVNRNGSKDLGLMQINSSNVGLLNLVHPFDPCESIRAAGDLIALMSRYNTGSPTRGTAYAIRVLGAPIAPFGHDPPRAVLPPPPPDPLPRPERYGRYVIFLYRAP